METLIVLYIMLSFLFSLLDIAYLISEKTHVHKLLDGFTKLFIMFFSWPSILLFSGLSTLKSIPSNVKIIFQNIKKHHFKS